MSGCLLSGPKAVKRPLSTRRFADAMLRRVDAPRTDPLSGTPVVVVTDRQDRPNLPDEDCPFCPGGREAPGPYQVRSFVNRWPAMPDDRCEVVLYSAQHDASLGDIGPAGVEAVVALWAERTAALMSRPDVSYVLVFENRGRDVGATIDHPHGQIYAYDAVPPVVQRELDIAARDRCALCRPAPQELVVADHPGWRVSCPPASSWPFELLLRADDHLPDLPSVAAEPSMRRGLAGALCDVVRRLDALFSAPMPYMLWVHQGPAPGPSAGLAHVHVHVAPVRRAPGVTRYVAGAELGAGIIFNPVDPHRAAAALRAVVR